jgi:hypothetical protein
VSQNIEKTLRKPPRKLKTTHAAQNYLRKKIYFIVVDVQIRKLSIAIDNISVHEISKS